MYTYIHICSKKVHGDHCRATSLSSIAAAPSLSLWERNIFDDVGKTVWFQIPIPSEILPTFEQGMKYMMATKKFVSDPSSCTSSVAQLLIGKSLVLFVKYI